MYNIYGKCYTLPTTKFNGEVIPTYKTQGFDPAERPLGRVAECSEAQGLYYLFTNPEFRAVFHYHHPIRQSMSTTNPQNGLIAMATSI